MLTCVGQRELILSVLPLVELEKNLWKREVVLLQIHKTRKLLPKLKEKEEEEEDEEEEEGGGGGPWKNLIFLLRITGVLEATH